MAFDDYMNIPEREVIGGFMYEWTFQVRQY